MSAHRRRAFTLIEVMLALALVAVLSGAVFAFAWNLTDRRAALGRAALDIHASTILIESLERDLAGAIAGTRGLGPGIVGSGTRLRILTRGVKLEPPHFSDADLLDDFWRGESEGGGGAGGEGRWEDLQGAEYVYDAERGVLRLRRWAGPRSGGSSESAAGRGARDDVLSERIERLRLRYFDGGEWLDSFNSVEADALPVAVEVAVWFAPLSRDRAVEPEVGEEWLEDEEGVGVLTEEDAFEEEFGEFDGEVEDGRVYGEPDRLRVIVVPDGPRAAWGRRR